MNNKAFIGIAFIIGAAIGSVVTLSYVKKKYENLAQEEIDSVKAVFSKRDRPIEPPEEYIDPESKSRMKNISDKPAMSEYVAKIQKTNYAAYSEPCPNPAKKATYNTDKEDEVMLKPMVIPPDDFGDMTDYEKIGLTYYADKVLVDEMDDVIQNVDELVGSESLNHFGEYEDDSVFVRNDEQQTYYEILLDHRNYSDVMGIKPHHMED